MLDLSIGIGCWYCGLKLDTGIGCGCLAWELVLGMGVGVGHWCGCWV